MKRSLFLIYLLFLFSIKVHGQCSNGPTITLSSSSGTTCDIKPVTVSGNIFGGSASKITITENGAGTVSPTTIYTSPFSFTYTPKIGDIGNKVEIILTTDNPLGKKCSAAKATYTLTVHATPTIPVIGTITRPVCTSQTGSIVLNGLPPSGIWTITMYPGGLTSTGSGTSTTVQSLSPGVFSFTVTDSFGCTSASTAGVTLTSDLIVPGSPVIGNIVSPTCSITTGSVQLTGLPAKGTWTLIRYPGTISLTGTGTNFLVTGLSPGVYNFTVTNESGCLSPMSANVSIPVVAGIPSAPVIGTTVQPVTGTPTGSVVLNGLPENGQWVLHRLPDNINISGTGNSYKMTGLAPGTYTFKVTNSAGCTSGLSDILTINSLSASTAVVITNPPPVCFPSTVDLTDPKITLGSTANLYFTYWEDDKATIPLTTPGSATAGIWYIKGTGKDNSYDIQPVTVTVYHMPAANAGPDQVLSNVSEATMDAEVIQNYETGFWSAISGTGRFLDPVYPRTTVSGLSPGSNIMVWSVTNGVCPVAHDTVKITVMEYAIPTLITPNMDGRNDYFVIKGIKADGRVELIVFDRWGLQVYKNDNYDNRWDGTDKNGSPLPEDTYFYTVKSESIKSLKGYLVIKR